MWILVKGVATKTKKEWRKTNIDSNSFRLIC